MKLTVNYPSWVEHGREIVTLNRVCPSPSFGGMWHCSLTDGGDLMLFGAEIAVTA